MPASPYDDVVRKILNLYEAKSRLSALVEEAAAGHEIIIAKAGKPVARIAPLGKAKAARKLGLLDKKARIPDDFNEPLPDEVLAGFLGGK